MVLVTNYVQDIGRFLKDATLYSLETAETTSLSPGEVNSIQAAETTNSSSGEENSVQAAEITTFEFCQGEFLPGCWDHKLQFC